MKNAILVIIAFILIPGCKKDSSSETLSESKTSVLTSEVVEITSWSAISGGIATSSPEEPVISRGICWGTSPEPTIAGIKAESGNGNGSYSSIIFGLEAGKTYYVRAYATSKKGTVYGSQLMFTTAAKTAVQGFKVCGSKIFGPDNKEFIIKGVNIGGPGWSWNENTSDYFDAVVNKWKFNTIRLCTKGGPSLDSQTTFMCEKANFPQYKYETFGTLRQIIKKYTDAKIVVIIEWHEVGGIFTDIACASNWWMMLAKEYKNNPYVWFDLYNEPQVNSNDTWKNSMQTVANAIRTTGNTNIIVATGNWWGQDANDWNCANVSESKSAILSQSLSDPVNNTIYSIHIYDQWTQCQSKLDNYFDRVIAQGKCIVVGEYGVYNNSDVSIAVDYTLAAVQPRNIGRIVWAWWGGDKNDLTTGGNGGGQHAQYDSNGSATNLTDFGSKVWNDLKRTETLTDIPAGCR